MPRRQQDFNKDSSSRHLCRLDDSGSSFSQTIHTPFHPSVDWCFTKCQKCVAADGKSADIQLANCSARARLLFQSQTQMKSCLHRFCPCWQSEGRSQVGTRLGVMVSTKRRQLSAKAAHKHLQTTYLGYVNAFLLIGYFSPKGTFQQTAVYVCTDCSYLTFPARVMLHLRGWRDTHRSWSFVNSLFSLHTERKKTLASEKTFKSAVLAAGTSGKRTNMRDQAEQTRRMTLNPTNQARSQQQEVSLIRQSNKQTSPWQDGRSETGSRSECRWQITGSLTGTWNRWTTKKHRTGDRRTSVARCKTEGQLCRVGGGLQGEETLWWKLLKRWYGIVEWTRRCKILYSFHFWAKLLLKQRFSKSYIWSLVCGEGRGTSS